MIKALREYHRYFDDTLQVELPRHVRHWVHLGEVADELARRLTQLFLRDETRGGWRPVLGDNALWQTDPHWHDYVPFYEYFHENGAGLGASHQGWTTLVADLLRPWGPARGEVMDSLCSGD